MNTDSDSTLLYPQPPIGYTLDVRDISRGFFVEPFEFYQLGQHWLKLVYFFDHSFSVNRWTEAIRELGQPNEGRTLKQNSDECWWRLNGAENHLVIGIYEHTFKEVCWFAVRKNPLSWETIHQDGSMKKFDKGTEQSETFRIAGQFIQLRFYNPVNTGGWTKDDIVYQITGLETERPG